MVVKIGHLEALNSLRDVYGNCYWAMRYTDYATKTTVCGRDCSGESNIKSIIYHWKGGSDYRTAELFDYSRQALKIREFNRLVKGWEYSGGDPERMVKFIKDRLPTPTPVTNDTLRDVLAATGLSAEQVEAAIVAARTPAIVACPEMPSAQIRRRCITRLALN